MIFEARSRLAARGRQAAIASRQIPSRGNLHAMIANRPTLFLLLPAMVLPVCVVLSDEAVLHLATACRWTRGAALSALAWFVFQTAVLSYIAGAKLPTGPWRLVVLGWTLLLVNMLLPAATTYAEGLPHVESLYRMLGRAFLSGEIACFVIWLVLGGALLMHRLALALLGALLAAYLAFALEFPSYPNPARWGGNEVWSVIVTVQIACVGATAAALRLRGFRIELMTELPTPPTSGQHGPIQFSVRHLIIATAFAAMLTFAFQRARLASSHALVSGQWLHASVVGALLSLSSLAAFWTVLGVGRWPVRLLAFPILIAAVGGATNWLESNIRYAERWGLLMPLTDLKDFWPAWTLLTGSFLAGMLLALRASGFRLVKRTSQTTC